MSFASTPGTDGTPRDLLAAATPRPWRAEETWLARSADDVEQMGYWVPEAECLGDSECSHMTKPNAALIVRAVNEYEALLAVEASLKASAFLLGGSYLAHARDSLATLDAIRKAR